MTDQKPSLLLVYNAKSGIFNALSDHVRKYTAPDTYECSLCAVTYGFVDMRWEWRRFLGKLPVNKRFLHRDEFWRDFPDTKADLPAIFLEQANGELELLIEARELDQINDLSVLIAMVSKRLDGHLSGQ